ASVTRRRCRRCRRRRPPRGTPRRAPSSTPPPSTRSAGRCPPAPRPRGGGAHETARWPRATSCPDPPPAEFLDASVAAEGPWGGIVAPRDFDPFAWMARRPWAGDWLSGMGREPGKGVLNGGGG